MSRTIIYAHVNLILDVPITYKNASVLCQSESACLHQTVYIVVFWTKYNENIYPKGRALIQMYRVVPQTNRGNKSTIILSKPGISSDCILSDRNIQLYLTIFVKLWYLQALVMIFKSWLTSMLKDLSKSSDIIITYRYESFRVWFFCIGRVIVETLQWWRLCSKMVLQ